MTKKPKAAPLARPIQDQVNEIGEMFVTLEQKIEALCTARPVEADLLASRIQHLRDVKCFICGVFLANAPRERAKKPPAAAAVETALPSDPLLRRTVLSRRVRTQLDGTRKDIEELGPLLPDHWRDTILSLWQGVYSIGLSLRTAEGYDFELIRERGSQPSDPKKKRKAKK